MRQRPDQQVGGDILFRRTLDRDEAVIGAQLGHAVAGEPSGAEQTRGYKSGGKDE